MEVKESLVTVIKALQEIKAPIVRAVLVDVLVGKETETISNTHLDDLECYGSGDNHDEDYWSNLIEAAINAEFIRVKAVKKDTVEYTSKGKSFARKPTSFIISDEEDNSADITTENGLDDIVSKAINEKKPAQDVASPKTKMQIKLIQAIDRKMALDDFAETEGVALEDVLIELEQLQSQGRKLDITYFTDEVIGKDDMQELFDWFDAEGGDIEKALNEYGDVFHPEEILLARIVWQS